MISQEDDISDGEKERDNVRVRLVWPGPNWAETFDAGASRAAKTCLSLLSITAVYSCCSFKFSAFRGLKTHDAVMRAWGSWSRNAVSFKARSCRPFSGVIKENTRKAPQKDKRFTWKKKKWQQKDVCMCTRACRHECSRLSECMCREGKAVTYI